MSVGMPQGNTHTEDRDIPERVEARPADRVPWAFCKGDFHDSGTRLSVRSYADDPLSGLPPWPPRKPS